jgi:hypothetical protein
MGSREEISEEPPRILTSILMVCPPRRVACRDSLAAAVRRSPAALLWGERPQYAFAPVGRVLGCVFRVPVENFSLLIHMRGDKANAEIFRSLSDRGGHHLTDAKVRRGRTRKR